MTPAVDPWTSAQKYSFRFFGSFFVLYLFPFPLNALQFLIYGDPPKFLSWYNKAFDIYTNLWQTVVPWIGKHLLHLKTPITIFTNGSGDTTYDYVSLLTMFVLALLATFVWTIVDRRRSAYRKAYYWLRVLVRYYLGTNMLVYGFSKVYHLQMPGPSLYQLVQRFGNKSPMGLAWSFIGFSPAFSAFTGWGEVVGGTLLFFRRTTLLGTLILLAVLTNVVAINFCYDVPVKLFSSVLLLMNLFLMVPYAGILMNILVWNRGAPALSEEYGWPTPRIHRVSLGLKWLFIVASFYGMIYGSIESRKKYGDLVPHPPLYGIYDVLTYIRNKDTVPPLTSDSSRWKQLIIAYDRSARIEFMNGTRKSYTIIVDSTLQKAVMYSSRDSLHRSSLQIRIDSPFLALKGSWANDTVLIRMKKMNLDSFILTGRGFHWINEYPFHQ